jgi:hypothetical protein
MVRSLCILLQSTMSPSSLQFTSFPHLMLCCRLRHMAEIMTHQQQPARDVLQSTHPSLFFPTSLPIVEHVGQHWNTGATGQGPSEPAAVVHPPSTAQSLHEPQLEGTAADLDGRCREVGGDDAVDSDALDEDEWQQHQLDEMEQEPASNEAPTMSGVQKQLAYCFHGWRWCIRDRSSCCMCMHLLWKTLYSSGLPLFYLQRSLKPLQHWATA